MIQTIIRNIFLGLALAAPIGPAGIAVIRNGLNHGFYRAFLTGVGITLADATYLLIVYFGLSSIIDIVIVKALLWILGAIVLIYLGYQSILGATKTIDLDRAHKEVTRNPLISGYLVNISNPIAVVFWLGIFGSLVETTEAQSKIVVLLLSSTILIGIMLWHSINSIVSSLGKRYLSTAITKYISIAAGIALILFGLSFAYHVVSLIIF